MDLSQIKNQIPSEVYNILDKEIKELRPAQSKAIGKGLLAGKNLLVCTPTASGKTLIAELAMAKSILSGEGKAIYIVPLKALANEKYKDFNARYGKLFNVGMSIGDVDAVDPYLGSYDLLITTSEKLDSLLRHTVSWLRYVNVVVIDEIHLLNDAGRGPTLEILITVLRELLSGAQLIALSATIGNQKQLASWLNAGLVVDAWRPVRLEKCTYYQGKLEVHR